MSQQQLRFDGKVVIVTGAGAGLGKTYALFFASRGAKVVVNDLGVTLAGTAGQVKVADQVVEEIRKAGGTAVASTDSVEQGEKIVKTALDAFGRVDVLINNAGFIRDKSFAKMTPEDFDKVVKVHLYGHFSVTKAVWNKMREQQYGRIINISSGSGLYGNFGQSNYAAAKMAIVGFTKTTSKEGGSSNIKVNAVCPIASTRMTEQVMNEEIKTILDPVNVLPIMAILAHDSCPETGQVFEVGGGWFSKLRWERSHGHIFTYDKYSPESLLANWSKVVDFKEPEYPFESWARMNDAIDLQKKTALDNGITDLTKVPTPKL